MFQPVSSQTGAALKMCTHVKKEWETCIFSCAYGNENDIIISRIMGFSSVF